MKGSYIAVIFVLLFQFNTLKGTNVVIIESQSFNTGHVMDDNWLTVCTGLGYTAAIYQQTQLDVNTWFGTTDVLIISSGVIALPANRIATIQAFLQQGGRVYLQTEYQSSYTSNGAYQQIVNAMGGSFAWGITYSGVLAPMVITGSLSTTPNAVSSISYFWYGVNGTAAGCNSHVEPFMTYTGINFGFIFCVPTNNARMITTCDQDWVNQLTSTPLMENIAINLANPTYTCVVASGGLNVNIGPDTTLCNGQSVTFNATTAGAISYLWSNNATTPTITVSTAGTYSVQVSNGSCTAYDTAVVSTGVTPTVSIAAPVPLTCTAPTQILTASSNIPGSSFVWSNGPNTATSTINAGGTYVVTATAPSGCTASISTNVTTNITVPNASAVSAGPLSCANTTDLLTASSTTAGATFNWGGGGNTAYYTAVSAGSYTVTVTDPANSCTNTATVNVTQTTVPPNISIAPPVVLTCATTSQTLTASSTATGATFSWSTGSNTAATLVSQPASYYVTVTDPGTGCTNNDSVAVTQSVLPPQVSIATPVILTCAVTSEALTASSTVAGAAFNWSNGAATAVSNVTAPGNYVVTATDPANGCTASTVTTVLQNITPPDVTIAPPAVLTCAVISVQLTASSMVAGVTYNWSGSATNVYMVSSTGNYSVTVTDPANGCTALASATVNQDINTPNLSIANPASLTCHNSSVTITASSTPNGVTYNWGNGVITATNTVSLAGSYQVTVTDALNGCTASASASVISIAPPSLTYTQVNVTCFGGNDGSVTATPLGGVTPYTFLWSGGQTTQNLSAVPVGSYGLTLTDSIGCTATILAALTAPPAILLADSFTAVSCNGLSDGAIQLYSSGGAAPLTYNWNDGVITANRINLAAASYTVTVTDNTLCTASITQNVSQPLPVAITDVSSEVLCFGGADGSIQLTTTGGTLPYTFVWSDGNAGQNRTNLIAGNYSVVVTDQHQCTANMAVVITQHAAVSMLPVLKQPTCPKKEDDGGISLVVSGGDSVYHYSWSDGSATDSIEHLSPGSYSVTVTDGHGCTINGTYVLSYIYNFSVNASPAQTIKLGQNAMLSYTVQGIAGNIAAHTWSPGYGLNCTDCANPVAGPNVTTTYQINIVNEAGCNVSDTTTVYVVPEYDIFVPNAFTPNGDGRNDYFQIFGDLETLQYIDVQIFDRIGEKVFESHDMFFKWDGTYKGVIQAPQVFAYQLKMVFIDGHTEQLKKGCVTLLR